MFGSVYSPNREVVSPRRTCIFIFKIKIDKVIGFSVNKLNEEIKEKVPVFGKEIFEDDTHQWKTNK